jgi:hypothetical protein
LTYTEGSIRSLLVEWGQLRNGEVGYPANYRDDLGTTIRAAAPGSRPPLRVELLDVDAAVRRLGPFEGRVVTCWYADGLGLADPFRETDVLATPPNIQADRLGVDAPDAGERIGHALGWHHAGRRLVAGDIWAARNRAARQMATALRATSLDPGALPARTNLAEVFQRLTPANKLIVDRWLCGHTPAEIGRMFDRNESSIRYVIRRFRAAIVLREGYLRVA